MSFNHNDWPAGFSHLARGSDKVLADLASQSLKTPYDAEAAMKMGDVWWGAGESNSKRQLEMALGARFWYRIAVKGALTPEAKKHVEERLAGIAKLRASDAQSLPSTIDLPLAPGLLMRFRLIPAGEFVMGSPDSKTKGVNPHPVKITRPFYMSATEVTQAQYNAIMGISASAFDSQLPYSSGDATKIGWTSADAFCQRLNAVQAFAPYTARLPTEAEWEYAARAGSTASYPFGDDPSALPSYACIAQQEAEPVGLLRPNAAGLFDVIGNVSEWCSDWDSTTFYTQSPPEDPTGPTTGKERIFRGGQFSSTPDQCKVWERHPGVGSKAAIGIRVVLGL